MAVTFFPLGLSKEARVTLSQVIYQLGQNKGLIRQADEQATSDPSVVTTVVIILLAISLSMVVLCFTFRAVFLAYHSEAMYMAFEEIEGFDDSEERIIRAKYPSNWTEAEEQSYELSRAFESHHPPGSHNAEITQEQERIITERGVTAWELEAGEEVNVIVEERTEVSFHGGEYCVQTNLPLPFRETVCYFEVKIFDKPDDTLVALGLTTKPFPSWRMPGKSRHSVGYHSNGRKYCNDPFEGRPFGPVFQKGDVIGCGYRAQTGTIFFTHNGIKIDSAVTNAHYNFFPAIGSNGPCVVHVNFGQMGFVYIEGNVRKWGLAPIEGNFQAPPAYGSILESMLLASEGNIPEEELSLLQLTMVPKENDRPAEHTVSIEEESTSTHPAESMISRIREWRVPVNFPWEFILPPPYTLVENPDWEDSNPTQVSQH